MYTGLILMDPCRPNPSAPPVYQPNRTSPQMRPAAPPVYHPNQTSPQMKPAASTVYWPRQTSPQMGPAAPPVYRTQASPRSLQPKPAISGQLGAPMAGLKPPTAPPVYRPHQRPYAAQPKVAGTNRATAVQLAKSATSGFSNCDASVVSASKSGEGSYKGGIHGEINALEDYLSKGGTIGEIEKINITSPPCKYCHLILTDLGIRDKVVAPGEGFGSCQGGSYGWFWSEGHVSKAVQKATGKSEKAYCTSVIDRKKGL